MAPPLVPSAVAVALAIALAGCSKCSGRGGDADATDAAPAASGSGAASLSDAELDRALADLAECDERPEGCAAEARFTELVGRIEAGDDYQRSRRAVLTRACGRALEHASASVRTRAHRCVAAQPEALAATDAEAKEALARLLTALENETDVGARRARWKAIGALDPTAHGHAARAAELAKKETEADGALDEALEALVPRSEYRPTAPEAFAFAREIAEKKTGLASAAVVDLVARSTAPPADACAIYADVMASKSRGWAAGLAGAADTIGRCKALRGKIVDAVVMHAGRGAADWSPEASLALESLVGPLELEAADKSRLYDAIASLPTSAREGKGAAAIDKVLEALR